MFRWQKGIDGRVQFKNIMTMFQSNLNFVICLLAGVGGVRTRSALSLRARPASTSLSSNFRPSCKSVYARRTPASARKTPVNSPRGRSYQWYLSAGRLIKSDYTDIYCHIITPNLITPPCTGAGRVFAAARAVPAPRSGGRL